jgi:hypothetical protein
MHGFDEERGGFEIKHIDALSRVLGPVIQARLTTFNSDFVFFVCFVVKFYPLFQAASLGNSKRTLR